jgi:hypothetical protein
MEEEFIHINIGRIEFMIVDLRTVTQMVEIIITLEGGYILSLAILRMRLLIVISIYVQQQMKEEELDIMLPTIL